METPRRERPAPPDEAANASQPTVSIVIPAYNEAHRIGPTIRSVTRFLEGHHLTSELLLVDDGSTDDTAGVAVREDSARLRVIRNERNRGKGYSVRRGFLEAQGEWVLFTDADLSAPIAEMDRLLEAVNDGADIAIGSRAVDRSKIVVHQSPTREWGGIVYNLAVRAILGLGIQDTQCGFKLFHRPGAEPVFRAQVIEDFGFDPEILFLAKRKGLRISEVPVEWSHHEGTKVNFWSDGVAMFVDLVRIRWRWMRGRYLF